MASPAALNPGHGNPPKIAKAPKGRHAIGTAVISDKRTSAQKLKDANKRSVNPQSKSAGLKTAEFAPVGSTPDTTTDVQTIEQRGGGLGGDSSQRTTVDTQTVAERGGGLGGDKSQRNPVDTKPVKGGLSFKEKKSLTPVIDKRTRAEKMKDAQNRRNR